MGPSAVGGDKGFLWQAESPYSSWSLREVSVALDVAVLEHWGHFPKLFGLAYKSYYSIKSCKSTTLYHLPLRGLWSHLQTLLNTLQHFKLHLKFCFLFFFGLRKIHPELTSIANLPLFCLWAGTTARPPTSGVGPHPGTEPRPPKWSVLN